MLSKFQKTTNGEPTGREVKEAWFSPVEGRENYWCCRRCDRNIRQNLKNGYSNLLNHVRKHENWLAEHQRLTSSLKRSNQTVIVSEKAITLFGWIDWVVSANLPFSFVEMQKTREHVNLHKISRHTLVDMMEKIGAAVEEKISRSLPEKFAIMFDGWSDNRSTHFIAIYAIYPGDNGQRVSRLLSFQPPLDEGNFTAQSHYELMESTLNRVNKQPSNVIFLVGDNCNVNKAVADLFGVPLLGCASHRFNLGMQRMYQQYEPLLNRVNDLMKKLKTPKRAAELRTKTHLRPVTRNVTRWNSTEQMITRYIFLREFMNTRDPEIVALLPSPAEEEALNFLRHRMICCLSVSKKLQKEELTMLDARALFDATMTKFPIMTDCLSPEADIIQSIPFEKGIVKIMSGRCSELTAAERRLTSCFVADDDDEASDNVEDDEAIDDFATRVLLDNRRKISLGSEFPDLSWIPPTSNMVERLFSRSKLTLGSLRHRMNPTNLELCMYLKANRELWNCQTIQDIITKSNKRRGDLPPTERPDEYGLDSGSSDDADTEDDEGF
jgi:hypothetical protein